MSAREAAEYLGVTKPQIFRLIKQRRITGHLNKDAPVPYYLIERLSIENYHKAPRNKGGRPKTTKR